MHPNATQNRTLRTRSQRLKADSGNVNNSTTLVDVPGLEFTVVAGKRYECDVYIKPSSATATLKYALTCPASSTGSYIPVGGTGAVSATALTTVKTIAGTAAEDHIRYTFTAGASGVAKVQFAQNAAVSENSKLLAGSSITFRAITAD